MKTLKSNSALLGDYKFLKEKHPEALILLRVNDFYESFNDDAIQISKILGIILAKRDDKTPVTGFPTHSLDTYLPKLVRSGNRVAICDKLESPANLVEEKWAKYDTDETNGMGLRLDAEILISEKRLKEINRLRAVISAGKGHNATFIEEVGTEQTGGGVMVDFVNFKTLPYIIGITDDLVVVYKNRASFCGDEADVIGSISLEEPKAGYQTLDYIDKVIADMEKLRHSFFRMKATWERDDKFGIDLNDYLQEKYPFALSLDELAFKVQDWENNGASKLIQLKRSLEVNIGNRSNNLGEPEVTYHPEVGKILNLQKGWDTEDGAYFHIEKITIILSDKTIEQLRYAMKKCKKNDWWAIEVRCDDDVKYIDEDNLPNEDWRADVEYFRVDPSSITLHAQHKHNSGAQIESESFTLDIFNNTPANAVGEPSAPYFTKAEAEGKWIMAFDTICQGWACVTDHEGKPALYNSKEEVEADDMFEQDEDFAVLATEYLEGRRLIFGGKGARTEGVSIVKAE
jgi:hypothetical protein